MTVNELINNYQRNNPNGHFFDRDTLKFFGETISSMHVHKGTCLVTDSRDEVHECYILSSLQRKHPCGPTRVYHYFDTVTFDQIVV